MTRLKTGIVGCGLVTDLHAKALANSDLSEFSAVCSRSQDKAERIAARYGVKAHHDMEQMVRQEGLDVVAICTPHAFHAGPTSEAAAAGAHVLVEKPQASTLADCDAMITATREAGVRLGMVSQCLFYRSGN